jgi:hypothetical protein
MAVLILTAEAAVAMGVAPPEYFVATGLTEVGVWFREDKETGERLTYLTDAEYSRRAVEAIERGEAAEGPPPDAPFLIRPGWSELLGRLAAWADGRLDEGKTVALFQELVDKGIARYLRGYARRMAAALVEAREVTAPDVARVA